MAAEGSGEQMKFETPWCVLNRSNGFYRDINRAGCFCDTGLEKWNIPKGSEVRLVGSNRRVAGAQKRSPTDSYLFVLLRSVLNDAGIDIRETVWWWPEIREPEKKRGKK